MRAVALIALLALGSCVSSKKTIEEALSESDDAAALITAEATATIAELDVVSALDLPDGARKPLGSASERQDRIIGHADSVREAADKGREGVRGVQDIPRPLWLKALGVGLLLVALGVALLAFAPGLVVRVIPALASILGRSRLSGAKLLQEGKHSEAIAAMRASDRRFDAAWRAGKR